MITDEELLKAAELIKNYCDNRENCDGCPFDGGILCLAGNPDLWGTDA